MNKTVLCANLTRVVNAWRKLYGYDYDEMGRLLKLRPEPFMRKMKGNTFWGLDDLINIVNVCEPNIFDLFKLDEEKSAAGMFGELLRDVEEMQDVIINLAKKVSLHHE